MAKKAVATLHEGSTDGRAYSKVIKMVKSPKTGAYVFDEQLVANDAVKDFFKYYLFVEISKDGTYSEMYRPFCFKSHQEAKASKGIFTGTRAL